MKDLDMEIEELEGRLSLLRAKVFVLRDKLRKKYYTQLESELKNLENDLDAIKEQLEKSYAADTELFNLQRENYFLSQGIGRQEMKKYIEKMERRKK